jgi:hypothetical protein
MPTHHLGREAVVAVPVLRDEIPGNGASRSSAEDGIQDGLGVVVVVETAGQIYFALAGDLAIDPTINESSPCGSVDTLAGTIPLGPGVFHGGANGGIGICLHSGRSADGLVACGAGRGIGGAGHVAACRSAGGIGAWGVGAGTIAFAFALAFGVGLIRAWSGVWIRTIAFAFGSRLIRT